VEPFTPCASSSTVGGWIAKQSKSHARSCSAGISTQLTAAKPGAGSPVDLSTTNAANAGRPLALHH
jgi:hypothetical protein